MVGIMIVPTVVLPDETPRFCRDSENYEMKTTGAARWNAVEARLPREELRLFKDGLCLCEARANQ
jgi:hypothetical protein